MRALVAERGLDAIYGAGAWEKVRKARVLVVGAGGVGCEVMKNLACSGVSHVTVVDLDTIDVSNLNRQFLFRREHVGDSKAEVAARVVQRMVEGCEVVGVVGNVKESRFSVDWFKDFTVVCNALDNLEARRYVNRMCLAAGVVLIESGSTGYNGQCTVIGKGKECYDCQPDKSTTKSYAVCTIRSTPDKPVHCIVWAKYLWELVFGADDDGNVLKDLDATASMAGAVEPLEEKENGLVAETDGEKGGDEEETGDTPKASAVPLGIRYIEGEKAGVFAARVCERVFKDDIEKQVAMTDLWKEREPPVPYDVMAAVGEHVTDMGKINLHEQRVWSQSESAGIFKAALMHVVETRPTEIGTLSFDKDDDDALAFVVAASNLRAAAYGVPLQSPFAVKGIAGNIIHAIATTNAVVGGMSVLQALRIIVNEGDMKDSKTSYVSRVARGSRVPKLCYTSSLNAPSKTCFVCSQGQLHLSMDVSAWTLRTLVDSVVKQSLIGALEPSINLTTGDFHNTLYECGEGLEDDEIEMYKENLDKKLSALRVETGSQLEIEDFAQKLKCTIHVTHAAELLSERPEGERFILSGGAPTAKENALKAAPDDSVMDVEDDDVVIVPEQQKRAPAPAAAGAAGAGAGRKRALEETERNGAGEMEVDAGPTVKRARGT